MSFCYFKGFNVHIHNIQQVNTTGKRVQRIWLGEVTDKYTVEI